MIKVGTLGNGRELVTQLKHNENLIYFVLTVNQQ